MLRMRLVAMYYYKRSTVATQPGNMMSNVGTDMSKTACFWRVFQKEINYLSLVYVLFDCYCQT